MIRVFYDSKISWISSDSKERFTHCFCVKYCFVAASHSCIQLNITKAAVNETLTENCCKFLVMKFNAESKVAIYDFACSLFAHLYTRKMSSSCSVMSVFAVSKKTRHVIPISFASFICFFFLRLPSSRASDFWCHDGPPPFISFCLLCCTVFNCQSAGDIFFMVFLFSFCDCSF